MSSQSSARSQDSSGTQCTRKSSRTRRSRRVVQRVASRRDPDVMQFSSAKRFSCQQTLHIVLNSRQAADNLYLAHRIAASDPTTQELTLKTPISDTRRISFSCLLSEPNFGYVQPRCIQKLLETTTDTLHLLHRHNISFPISLEVLSVVLPANYAVPRTPAQPLAEFLSQEEAWVVFYEYNRSAAHLSLKYGSTGPRRARQMERELKAVVSLMTAVQVLLRLRNATAPCRVDAPTQLTLADFLTSDDASMAHVSLVNNKIANPIPWMAATLSSSFLAAGDEDQSRAVLDAALGGGDAAPRDLVDPAVVLSFYNAQRRRKTRHGETQVGDDSNQASTDTRQLDVELDGHVLARLLIYYITATNMTQTFDNRHRWRDAVIMYDAHLANKEDSWYIRGFVLDKRTDQERELLLAARSDGPSAGA
ncbi:hypothetical protein B0T19DRAFT_294566 [Cercophora scortea]|uniref:Uncharacterized protein n=1 Tax=Cercophora scortea TaxID=314031 RepID=A0AAE0I363_9PEZI|nr:hypothetical protein B0T19DRAFT_294566 [Cercophora scortea]